MMEFKGLKNEYEILEDKIVDSLKRLMRSGSFILGKEVAELEAKLADFVGVKHCVSCANATDGLILSLMAAGVGSGDHVLVPNFSYIASASCVSLIGAVPVFVDIDADTYNISASSLENAISACQEQGIYCKALITVDLFGLPADYDSINTIAKKYGLIVIEDGAQGFGGKIANRRACSFGDIAVTSFFPVKPLGAYGDGGAIFTNDDQIAELVWSLRSHGRTRKNKYDNSIVGFNSRLDTLQAAILLQKFELFTDFELQKVDEIAQRYSSELSSCVKTPVVPDGFFSSWAQYTIALKSREQRAEMAGYLKNVYAIPTMIYYDKPLHEQGAVKNGLVVAELQNSIYASNTVLSLPIHPFLNDEEIDCVIEAVKSFWK